MKVRELMEMLSKVDPEALVFQSEHLEMGMEPTGHLEEFHGELETVRVRECGCGRRRAALDAGHRPGGIRETTEGDEAMDIRAKYIQIARECEQYARYLTKRCEERIVAGCEDSANTAALQSAQWRLLALKYRAKDKAL